MKTWQFRGISDPFGNLPVTRVAAFRVLRPELRLDSQEKSRLHFFR